MVDLYINVRAQGLGFVLGWGNEKTDAPCHGEALVWLTYLAVPLTRVPHRVLVLVVPAVEQPVIVCIWIERICPYHALVCHGQAIVVRIRTGTLHAQLDVVGFVTALDVNRWCCTAACVIYNIDNDNQRLVSLDSYRHKQVCCIFFNHSIKGTGTRLIARNPHPNAATRTVLFDLDVHDGEADYLHVIRPYID